MSRDNTKRVRGFQIIDFLPTEHLEFSYSISATPAHHQKHGTLSYRALMDSTQIIHEPMQKHALYRQLARTAFK